MLVAHLRIKEPTLLSAISTMLALHSVFNMEFLPNAAKTCELLSHIIGVDYGVVTSALVLVAIGIIDG